jgi:hypothetical protein
MKEYISMSGHWTSKYVSEHANKPSMSMLLFDRRTDKILFEVMSVTIGGKYR